MCMRGKGESTCEEILTCCDCGGNDCGCIYCWSCNACEDCLNSEDEHQ